MEPTPKPIDYATPALPKPIEGPLPTMMKFALVAVFAQVPWALLISGPFRQDLDSIYSWTVFMAPSLIAWLFATNAYYRFDRRHPTALIIVISLVIVYAGFVSFLKFSSWRHWHHP